jgi:hypothetical protein
VDVAREFKQVGLLLDHNRLVAILEEVAAPVVAPIKGPRIAREEGAHGSGERDSPGPHQEVGVVGQ